MDLRDKIITFVFASLYTILYFNWIVYLIQTNFDVLFTMTQELVIKGLIIGFSGAWICDKVEIGEFAPYGWAGVLFGFNVINVIIIPAVTPYNTLLGLDLAGTLTAEFLFMKMVVVSSFIYYLIRGSGSFLLRGLR